MSSPAGAFSGSGTVEQAASLLGEIEFSKWNAGSGCSVSKGGLSPISTGLVPLFQFEAVQRCGVYRFQASSKSCRSYPWAVSLGDVRTLRLCTPKGFNRRANLFGFTACPL